jgi:hypothetical protein
MKINEETTVSEEQVLFNKLSYEEQQFILKQMRMLQPCELSCKIEEEEKKIPEKLGLILDEHFTNDELQEYIYEMQVKINEIIDYLKSKGE